MLEHIGFGDENIDRLGAATIVADEDAPSGVLEDDFIVVILGETFDVVGVFLVVDVDLATFVGVLAIGGDFPEIAGESDDFVGGVEQADCDNTREGIAGVVLVRVRHEADTIAEQVEDGLCAVGD